MNGNAPDPFPPDDGPLPSVATLKERCAQLQAALDDDTRQAGFHDYLRGYEQADCPFEFQRSRLLWFSGWQEAHRANPDRSL